MAFSFSQNIEAREIARQMSNGADDTAAVIEHLAEIFADEGDADWIAQEIADQMLMCEPELIRQAAYLLRTIVERLEAI